MLNAIGNIMSEIGSVDDKIIGYVDNAFNKQWSEQQAKDARAENFIYNERAADAALSRQKDLQAYLQKLAYQQYYDLESPAAIIEQLKKAGLSPSLYAGGNVGGGVSGINTATAPQGGGASGVGAPSAAYSSLPATMHGSGDYLAMAQAELAHEQAQTLRGENARGDADLKKILSEIGLTKSAQQLNQTQNAIKNIELAVSNATQEDAIDIIRTNAKTAEYASWQAYWNAANNAQKWSFDKETFKERVEQVKQDVINTIADTALKLSEKQLNDEQKAKLIAETEKIYNELFYFQDVEFESAKSYQKWLNKQTDTLDEKLRLMGEEIGVKKIGIWVNAGTDILKTAGNLYGLMNFAKGGKSTTKDIWKPRTLQTTTPMPNSQWEELMKNMYY